VSVFLYYCTFCITWFRFSFVALYVSVSVTEFILFFSQCKFLFLSRSGHPCVAIAAAHFFTATLNNASDYRGNGLLSDYQAIDVLN